MSRRGKERVFISAAQRIISDELAEALKIPRPQADEVARQAVHGICSHFAKQLVYISAATTFTLQARDHELWNRFDGHNHDELAQSFELSVVQVYKIIKIMRAESRKKTEPSLPGFEI
jgi:Mor family transcriptional regulator